MLVEAVEKNVLGTVVQNETDSVLTLVGKTVGLGARGEHVGFSDRGRVTIFSRKDARKMLAKFDKATAEENARLLTSGVDRSRPALLLGPRARGM